MAEYQTVVNNLDVIRGNGLVEVAAYTSGTPSWKNVGAITGLAIEEALTISKEENDNADSTDRASKQEVKIKFTQLEIMNLDVWQILRGSLDTVVTDSNETKIFSGDKSVIPEFMVRVTTKNDGRAFYLTAYRCTLAKGFTFEYQKDDADDRRLKNPVEITGKTDANRSGYVWEIMSDYYG